MKKEDLDFILKEVESIVSNIDCEDFMMNTDKCIEQVSKNKNVKIAVRKVDFSFDDEVKDCGAFMQLKSNNGQNTAIILLNSSKDAIFQRFSLMHELGHIVSYDFGSNNKIYNCAHIRYTLNYISDDICEKNKELYEEQKANIFALELLMPRKKFYEVCQEKNSIIEIAKVFGVAKEAVESRLKLLIN